MTRAAIPSPCLSGAPPGGPTDRGLTVGMISNPLSGGNKRGIGRIRDYLAAHPRIHAAEASTPEELNGVMTCFARRAIDLLIINGGDGTVQAALTSLFAQPTSAVPPMLALLQAGTSSMLARDLGARGEPLAALKRITAWSNDRERDMSRVHQRMVLRVRQETGPGPLCGMFFGAGAIPRGIELCHSSINPSGIRGELMPGLVAVRLLLALLSGNGNLVPPTAMNIRVDGAAPHRDSYLLAMVSTLERLFLGLHPFWGKEDAPLRFTALKTRPPRFLRNLPFLLRGIRTSSATEENGYYSHNAAGITLDFRGPFTLDGEIFQACAPLTIEAAGPARFLSV